MRSWYEMMNKTTNIMIDAPTKETMELSELMGKKMRHNANKINKIALWTWLI